MFVLLYIIAAVVYPGGNQFNQNSKGFSVLHNYWCDLLNIKAQNGEANTSRPYAIAATIIVCASLVFFWYYVSKAFPVSAMFRSAILIPGITSMLVAMFIVTGYHDEAIAYSGFLGGVAFMATFYAIYKAKLYKVFGLGILCLVLGAITFGIYKTRTGLVILPMIQKTTLLLCLLWITIINMKMKKQVSKTSSRSERDF
jgi:hypothetical protein